MEERREREKEREKERYGSEVKQSLAILDAVKVGRGFSL